MGITTCFPPVGVYSAYSFVGNYILTHWRFTIILLSWGNTWMIGTVEEALIGLSLGLPLGYPLELPNPVAVFPSTL